MTEGTTAACSKGIKISWWPVRAMPAPPGRSRTLSRPRYCCWKVEVGGGHAIERETQVAGNGDRLEEYFGHDDGTAQVEPDSSVPVERLSHREYGSRPDWLAQGWRRQAAVSCVQYRCRSPHGPLPGYPSAGPRPAGWHQGLGPPCSRITSPKRGTQASTLSGGPVAGRDE